MSNIHNLPPARYDKFFPGSLSIFLKRDAPFISQCLDSVGVPQDSIRVSCDTEDFLPFHDPEASIPVEPSTEIVCDEILVKRRLQEVVSFILTNSPSIHLRRYLPRIKSDCAEILGLFSRFNSGLANPDDISKLDKMANILRVDADCEAISVYASISHSKSGPIGGQRGLTSKKGFIPDTGSSKSFPPRKPDVAQTYWPQDSRDSTISDSVFLGDICHGHSGVSIFNDRIDFFDIHEESGIPYRKYYSALWGGTEGIDWAISVSRKTDRAEMWDDHADAEDILEYLVGWRVDAPKGGKGSKKKRTEKPKCTKGRSCGMSCIPQSRKCKSDLSPAADAVAKSVASSGGGATSGGKGKGQSSKSVKPKATQEKVPDTIADRNKPLYKAAIDGKQIRVTADQRNAAAPVTGNAGPWQNSKVDRIRKEKAKVTKDEAAALAAYIGAKYAPMSAAIYAPGDPSVDAPGSVDAANRLAANAMRKLDPITEDSINARAREYAARNGYVGDAPLYDAGRGLQRGITLNGQAFKDKITQYQTALAGDGLVREDTWFATSTLSVENDDVSIAAQSNVIYRIKPNLNGTGQGRYVDHFKNRITEGEVLYPPYSQFRVTGVQVSKDKNAVIAEMGLTSDQQKMMMDAYNASYYQQTFVNWKNEYEMIIGEKPPSASNIKQGLALRQQVESQVTGSGVTYIDLEEL